MEPLRMGIVGLGNMGASHAKNCVASELIELVAVCDSDNERLDEQSVLHNAKPFSDASAMMDSAGVEAVLIATPHYEHTPQAISAS